MSSERQPELLYTISAARLAAVVALYNETAEIGEPMTEERATDELCAGFNLTIDWQEALDEAPIRELVYFLKRWIDSDEAVRAMNASAQAILSNAQSR